MFYETFIFLMANVANKYGSHATLLTRKYSSNSFINFTDNKNDLLLEGSNTKTFFKMSPEKGAPQAKNFFGGFNP